MDTQNSFGINDPAQLPGSFGNPGGPISDPRANPTPWDTGLQTGENVNRTPLGGDGPNPFGLNRTAGFNAQPDYSQINAQSDYGQITDGTASYSNWADRLRGGGNNWLQAYNQ